MAHLGKQMRVGARDGSAYNSVQLLLLANGKKYKVDSNTFLLSVVALALPQLRPFFHTRTHLYSVPFILSRYCLKWHWVKRSDQTT